MHQMIDLIAILTTLLLTGAELTVGVFVHPVLTKLPDAAHARAAKPLAQVLGKVMPFWYAAAVLLVAGSVLVRPVGTGPWWAALSSAVLLAATVPFSLVCLVPRNSRVAALDPDALPDGWKDDRRKWDQYHAVRIAMLLLASVAVLAAALWPSAR